MKVEVRVRVHRKELKRREGGWNECTYCRDFVGGGPSVCLVFELLKVPFSMHISASLSILSLPYFEHID